MVIKPNGYTLIELLVVTGIVGILSVSMVGIFLSTLVMTAKAKLENALQTQGDYAIASMERVIRNARSMPECNLGPGNNWSLTFPIQYTDSRIIDITYAYNGSQIVYTRGDSASSILIGGQSNLAVTSSTLTCTFGNEFYPGKISLNLTLQATGRTNLSQQFNTSIAIRSY